MHKTRLASFGVGVTDSDWRRRGEAHYASKLEEVEFKRDGVTRTVAESPSGEYSDQ